MASLQLPSVAMDLILSFCDATDLARLAQVSKVWQRIVYRKSVWQHMSYEYMADHEILLSVPPRGARHIQAHSNACFIRWLRNMRFGDHSFALPEYIHHTEDPKKFLERAHKFWIEHGRPCFIQEHHHIADLLIAPLPKTLSKADRSRILFRLVKPKKAVSKNVYATYLLTELIEITWAYHELAPPAPPPAGSDPYAQHKFKTRMMLRERAEHLRSFEEAVRAVYTRSTQLLTAHGIALFDTNDSWFAKNRDAAWSAAGFSYLSASALVDA